MNKWYIELYVDKGNFPIDEPFVRESQIILSVLATCLQDPSFTIVKLEEKHFWLSSDVEGLTDENEVYQYAQTMLPVLNGIMQIKYDLDVVPIKIGDVYHLDTDGKLKRNGMRVTWTLHGTFLNEQVLLSKNTQRPQVKDILRIANHNPLVAEALQHLATSHNWYSLEKIFEIIAKDMGKKENSRIHPRGTFDRWSQGRNFGHNPTGKSFDFLQSAHSYHLSGFSARHSSVESKQITGVNKMALPEAIEYVTNLLWEWLKTFS